MGKHKPFGALTKRLPAARKARIENKAAALNTALTLYELRKARRRPQGALSHRGRRK